MCVYVGIDVCVSVCESVCVCADNLYIDLWEVFQS